MVYILQTAMKLGCIYALVSLALFMSFLILKIADITTDGCFILGGAVSVVFALTGHPFVGLILAMLAGSSAGLITAVLQTRMGVPSIRYHYKYRLIHHQSDGYGLQQQPVSSERRDSVLCISEDGNLWKECRSYSVSSDRHCRNDSVASVSFHSSWFINPGNGR